MSTRTDLTLVQTLTTYAYGLAQDIRSAVADFIAPEAPVGVVLGNYKKYDDKNSFVIYSRARAVGGPASRVVFGASDGTFNCKPNSLEATIDDAERSPDGDDAVLEQAKVRTLVINNVVSREYDVITKAKTQSAVGGIGEWSKAATDPIIELDAQIEALVKETGGVLPGTSLRVLFGLSAFRLLRNNPNVIKRFPGAQSVSITPAKVSELLLLPCEIKVATMSYDTSKLGQSTTSKANIVGDNAFVFLASQNPTVMDPSFMKIFTVRGGSITNVWTYRDNIVRSDVYAVDVSEDIQITGAACCKRISVT